MHEAKEGVIDQVSLSKKFQEVRKYTLELCAPLEIEDYLPQPVEDVSPAKWNIAHTTWFFEEMILKNRLPGYQTFDPDYSFLFNSYYNTIGERTLRHKRGDLSRPTVARVLEYREFVESKMEEVFSQELSSDVLALIELGINHEQQHQELFLTDLKYVLSLNKVPTVYRDGLNLANREEPVSKSFHKIESGFREIGHNDSTFCFDNELPRHRVWIDDFQISADLVTNAEFIEFIDSGAYADHRLWHAEAWDWIRENKIQAPLYWSKEDDGWMTFTLAGWELLNPGAPVTHVSLYEAFAFAEFAGKRLPSEFEWEAASEKLAPANRWEWTSSAYQPYPGFETSPGAVGEYNGKFMINQYVLRGGSAATPKGHSRVTYRNFFHPHLRWQFNGIRLANK